jgi:dihydrolipoamide dehydrogenase
MVEKDCFCKAVVEKKTGRILGFHIIGPQAPNLIQEVVNAVEEKRTVQSVLDKIHIFPALSNLIPECLSRVKQG